MAVGPTELADSRHQFFRSVQPLIAYAVVQSCPISLKLQYRTSPRMM